MGGAVIEHRAEYCLRRLDRLSGCLGTDSSVIAGGWTVGCGPPPGGPMRRGLHGDART
jgi:hypothetical protein